MAEPIGVASGVLALGTFAFKAGTCLYNTIESFQSHSQRVKDLLEENGALNSVLASLNKTTASATDIDLSALEVPLTCCRRACEEFNRQIENIKSAPGWNPANFRGWARLRYMGEDIDGFRRLLAGYKATISIALADATFQKSSHTSEQIKGYSQLINTATADFEDRLQRIDDTLEILVMRQVETSGSEADQQAATVEVEQIQEERLSTEKCLQICAQLKESISQLRPTGRKEGSENSAAVGRATVPETITNEGLDECEESLSRMVEKLARHEKHLFDQLASMVTKPGRSDGNSAEIKRLRDEWESTRTQMNILSKAERKLEETVSVIRNRANGNALQLMVSTDGKPLRGTNEGTGQFIRQFGGYMSNETVQKIMQSMVSMTVAASTNETTTDGQQKARTTEPTATRPGAPDTKGDSKFEDLYGEGFSLCESPTGSTSTGKRA